MYLTQCRAIDDDVWQFFGEYPTKSEAQTAANIASDYPTYYRARVHRINESWHKQFPDNCPIIEVTGDGKEAGTCTYHLKNRTCPRHGVVKDEP